MLRSKTVAFIHLFPFMMLHILSEETEKSVIMGNQICLTDDLCRTPYKLRHGMNVAKKTESSSAV